MVSTTRRHRVLSRLALLIAILQSQPLKIWTNRSSCSSWLHRLHFWMASSVKQIPYWEQYWQQWMTIFLEKQRELHLLVRRLKSIMSIICTRWERYFNQSSATWSLCLVTQRTLISKSLRVFSTFWRKMNGALVKQVTQSKSECLTAAWDILLVSFRTRSLTVSRMCNQTIKSSLVTMTSPKNVKVSWTIASNKSWISFKS